ncbi:hypothetical protein KJ762_01995, partial [bacterium]|nr:hypothetical protein [bacterium]
GRRHNAEHCDENYKNDRLGRDTVNYSDDLQHCLSAFIIAMAINAKLEQPRDSPSAVKPSQ